MTILRKELSTMVCKVKNKAGDWINIPIRRRRLHHQYWRSDAAMDNGEMGLDASSVVNPPLESRTNKDRLSIVFFHQPITTPSSVVCLAARMPNSPRCTSDYIGRSFAEQVRQADNLRRGDKAA